MARKPTSRRRAAAPPPAPKAPFLEVASVPVLHVVPAADVAAVVTRYERYLSWATCVAFFIAGALWMLLLVRSEDDGE